MLTTTAVFEDSVATAFRVQVLKPWLADLRRVLTDAGCADAVAAAKLAQSQVLFNTVGAPALAERLSAAKLATSLSEILRPSRSRRGQA